MAEFRTFSTAEVKDTVTINIDHVSEIRRDNKSGRAILNVGFGTGDQRHIISVDDLYEDVLDSLDAVCRGKASRY